MRYVEVILPVPLDGTFTYSLTDEQADRVQAGMRVLVPFGASKRYMGIALRVHDEKPGFKVKPVVQLPDEEPVVLPRQLELWQWMSRYYMSPIGEVYKAALPSGLKAEEGYAPKTETFVRLADKMSDERSLHIAFDILKNSPAQSKVLTAMAERGEDMARDELMNITGCTAATLKKLIDRSFLATYEHEVGRLGQGGEPHPDLAKQLNTAQQDAYNNILMQFMKKKVVLLHGVTSSGKTEIYIHLIQKTIDEGRQVLFLMPEIALTVQMMERLRRVFGNRLGIYHSRYSDAERVEIWQKQLSRNPYDVILGARSAVFLPFQRLGLVIVDEEHETCFKQQDPMPRYHARDVAIMMGSPLPTSPRRGGDCANVLLGTATPSMESYQNAQTGKYGLVSLTTRYQGIELPEIQLVDVKDLQRRKMMRGPFSPQLIEAMRQTLHEGRQVILFQNRRGFSPQIECRTCGWVPRCKNCDVSLTWHKRLNILTCHYCGYTYAIPDRCPACEEKNLRSRGYGTEKIEDLVSELLPEARVARMDLDTTRSRDAYEHIISDFAAGRSNVLIGTQMITKGLDFDRVQLVGILDADAMLNQPDFRAYEHAFMMMSQVAGRAGRKGRRGLVMLQTKNKELPVIRQVIQHDYRSFYHDLLDERRDFHYPPFYRLIYVYLKHRSDDVVDTAGIEMGSRLRQWFGQRVLGPDKPSVAKVKSLCIRKLVLKLENGIDIWKVRQYLTLAQQQLMQQKRYAALQVYYDVDPI